MSPHPSDSKEPSRWQKLADKMIERYSKAKSHRYIAFLIFAAFFIVVGIISLFTGITGSTNFTYQGMSLNTTIPGIVFCAFGLILAFEASTIAKQ